MVDACALCISSCIDCLWDDRLKLGHWFHAGWGHQHVAKNHHNRLPLHSAHILLHCRGGRGEVLADPQGQQSTTGNCIPLHLLGILHFPVHAHGLASGGETSCAGHGPAALHQVVDVGRANCMRLLPFHAFCKPQHIRSDCMVSMQQLIIENFRDADLTLRSMKDAGGVRRQLARFIQTLSGASSAQKP